MFIGISLGRVSLQVPLPFIVQAKRTYDFKGAKDVRIRQHGGEQYTHRQFTLQLCIRPLGKQPPPCLIIRGKPESRKQDKQEEALGYHKGVWVIWQDNAWVDVDVRLADSWMFT